MFCRSISSWRRSNLAWAVVLGIGCLLFGAAAKAQEPEPAAPADAPVKFRKLAPGVLKFAERMPSVGDTYSYHDVKDLLEAPSIQWKNEYTPNSQTLKEMLTKVPFRRDIWELEFAFKPVRYIDAFVPDENGKVVQRRVWYMVYRVRNVGGTYQTTPDPLTGLPMSETVNKPIRFIPRFWLQGNDVVGTYPDRLLPVVIPAIERREDPNRKLLDSVAMSQIEIPVDDSPDGGVWGVVTWDTVPAATDKFSIFVQGLTNAYKWVDQTVATPEGANTLKRRYAMKTLKLNFWRPGDEFDAEEREIRYGAPGERNHEWLFLEVE